MGKNMTAIASLCPELGKETECLKLVQEAHSLWLFKNKDKQLNTVPITKRPCSAHWKILDLWITFCWVWISSYVMTVSVPGDGLRLQSLLRKCHDFHFTTPPFPRRSSYTVPQAYQCINPNLMNWTDLLGNVPMTYMANLSLSRY